MTREEKRIEKLQTEARDIVADNIEHREQIKKNVAMLKATAELIRARMGSIPDEVKDELEGINAE